MKRSLQALAGALLVVLILAAYVTLKVAGDLRAVRSIVTRDVEDIDPGEVAEAESRLESAQETLGGPASRMLQAVPVLGKNLQAISRIVDASLPVLRAGSDLSEAVAPLRDGGLFDRRRIDASKIAALQEPAGAQVTALSSLVEEARSVRSGWLLPPLWDAVDDTATRSAGLLDSVANLQNFIELSDEIIGVGAPRTYLALLLNNAELRGAGGILAGVGTVTFDEGRVKIGRFRSVHDLRTRPPESVSAPDDYLRRYSDYKANTTLWLNTSFSPDVPAVSQVAARLFKLTTGRDTDGAFVLDPRGISALLPSNAKVEIPGQDDSLAADEVAPFIYSDAYAEFKSQAARRNAILALGERAFEIALKSGFGGTEGIDQIAAATQGGHIRFVSFHEEERELLDRAGVSGELDVGQNVVPIGVVAQNFGSDNGEGTKLDFWAERSIAAECALEEEEENLSLSCNVETTIANETPPGLGEYVGGRPYGDLKTFIETYVPEGAEVTSSSLNETPTETFVEEEGTSTSVGVFATIPRGSVATTKVEFTQTLSDESVTLEFRPQPLARDAALDVSLSLPSEWRAVGAESTGSARWHTFLDKPLEIKIERDPRSGLTSMWQRLKRFWREPLG